MKILTLILSLTVSLFSYSKEFSYDYIETKLSRLNTDNKLGIEEDYLSVSYSKSLNNNFSLKLDLEKMDGDCQTTNCEFRYLEGNTLSIDGTYHYPIVTKTDLIHSIGYTHSSKENNCFSGGTGECLNPQINSKVNSKKYSIKSGFKHLLIDDIEIQLQYIYTKTKKNNSKNRETDLLILKSINKEFSVGVNYLWDISSGNNLDRFGLLLRRDF